MFKIFKKILFALFLISTVFTGFIAGKIFVMTGPFFDLSEVLKLKGFPSAYSVMSGSMEPAIKTGGIVVSIPLKDYKTGDVITFKESEKSKVLVTHRIVAKYYSYEKNDYIFYTKGDANRTLDTKPITRNQIIGQTVLSMPGLGILAQSVRDPKIFIILVIIPATIIVYEELKYIAWEILKLFKKYLKKLQQTNSFTRTNAKGVSKAFLIVPTLGILIALTGITGSFFSANIQSSGNILAVATFIPTPIASATPTPNPSPEPTAEPNCAPAWANAVVGFSQGTRKDGSSVLLDRTDPQKVLGSAQSSGANDDNPVTPGSFFSLGFNINTPLSGGTIILSYTSPFFNQTGNDIQVFEVTGGIYPDEKVKVEISQDGSTWTVIANSLTKDGTIDMGSVSWAKFIRLTDVSDVSLFDSTGDGYDLDAVKVTCQNTL